MVWATLALGAAKVGSSLIAGKKASDAAKEAANDRAALTLRQRKEEIRYRSRGQRKEQGLAKATVYASNILNDGSSKQYLNELNMENMRETKFAKTAAELENRAIKAGGKGAGTPYYAQAAGDAIGTAAGMYAIRATPDTSSTFGGAPDNPLAQAQPDTYSYSSTPGSTQTA